MNKTPEHDRHDEHQDEGAQVVPFPGSLSASPPAPEVIEAEIVEEKPARPVNLPAQKTPLPWNREPQRRPVIPDWLSDPATRREVLRRVAGYYWHATKYHTVRVPVYGLLVAAYAPRGLLVVTGRVWIWVTDAETRPLRASAVRRDHLEDYLKIDRVRAGRVRPRQVTVGLSLTGLITLIVLLGFAPLTAQLAAGLAAALALARAGQPADRPIVGHAVVPLAFERLTDAMVVAALASLGIKKITFPEPIREAGRGWAATVDLPLGTTAEQVIDKRPELASGLRRPLSTVWPEPVNSEHPGRLELFVLKQDPAKTGPVRWTLATKGTHDYFDPAPFGEDQRGRPVLVPLYQHNILIGSLPGQGKTGVVRVLACAAALDATAELWLAELKGSGDLDPLESVSHRYVSGIDDESIEYAAESLRLLRAEVMRRTSALKTLPRDLCPDKRVTRPIADKRSLRLWPLVCVIDECQNLFAHPEFGEQASKDAEFIIKIGRAFGVTLILATQRPDQKSLPTGVSGNVSIRFCLKVAGQVENDMILGTSAYKNGLRATTLRAGIDAGIGYLVGATPEPIVVRVAYLDQPATERIAVRARALREAAGTLTGHALGEHPDRAPAHHVLDDLGVVYATAERLWSETACERLAELRPGAYAGWGAKQLTAALKPYGLTPHDLWDHLPDGTGANRKGLTRAEVQAALATHRPHQLGPGT